MTYPHDPQQQPYQIQPYQPQPYQPQLYGPAYPVVVPQMVMRVDRNGMGTAGMVLGIIGAVTALIPLVGIIAWLIAPLGLILAFVGLARTNRGEATNRGVAIAGIVTSFVGVGICTLWVLFFFVGVAAAPVTAVTR